MTNDNNGIITPSMIKMKKCLQFFLSSENSSDLYIREKPAIRDGGSIVAVPDLEPLTEEELSGVVKDLIRLRYKSEETVNTLYEKAMELNEEVDISITFPGQSKTRSRINIYKSMGKLGAILRKIPAFIPELKELGFYSHHLDCIKRVINKREGLILVTGQTGTGKTTTLASIIDYLNQHYSKHIVTIEDPIEFKHQEKSCIVTQREVGVNADTKTFNKGLVASLRQAPDVILVGEMRDGETAQAAMHAAQTGHLVFSTLHTNSAPETVLRIIDMFDSSKEKAIKVSLASSLLMIISQKLIPNVLGKRELCYEIMLNSSSIKNLIITDSSPENKIIQEMISNQQSGNIPLNYLLLRKIQDRLITQEKAIEYSNDSEGLIKLVTNTQREMFKQSNMGVPIKKEENKGGFL